MVSRVVLRITELGVRWNSNSKEYETFGKIEVDE